MRLNKKQFHNWVKALREFAKKPSYLHLRCPLALDTVKGEALSPFGILCQLHAEDTGGKWEPTEGRDGKLRDHITYLGEYITQPKEVEEWIGLSAGFLSAMSSYNDVNDGFISMADALDKWFKDFHESEK
jgi:hypothetical protein